MNERIAIIVLTLNADFFLPHLLPFLKDVKKELGVSVYFFDSESCDATPGILESSDVGELEVVERDSFDHGGTRTMAAKQVDADFLVFITQDALPTGPQAIERLTAAFANSEVAAAFGRQLPYDHCHLFGHHLRRFNYGSQSYVRSLKDRERFGIKTAFLSNSFAAYRRTALEQIGWFKDGLILGEDSYAGGKLLLAGHKLAYVADAEVYHSHSYTVWQEFRRYFDIGVFHAMEPWLLQEFGRPEGEGMRYIRSEFDFLRAQKAMRLLPQFVLRNGMKWLGYKLGKHYARLPSRLLPRLSMHHRWWR